MNGFHTHPDPNSWLRIGVTLPSLCEQWHEDSYFVVQVGYKARSIHSGRYMPKDIEEQMLKEDS